MTAIPIDRDYLTDRLVDLVQIDSVNPDLVPGGAGEGEVGAYLARALEALGLAVEVEEVEPGRPNVVGILRGAGNGRSLLLNAHTDIVGVDGMAEPFSGAFRDGRVYGRGAYDMKASLAAMLAVMKGFVDAGVQPGGDLLFTAVVDEEHGSKGMEALVKRYRTDGAIVTEPTGLRICTAHRGFVWLEVITRGRAAHGSSYRDGIDANMHMGRVLVALEQHARDLLKRDPHPLLGPPSLHAPLIKGGSSQSVYAAQCRAELERRILPGETAAQVVAEVQALLDQLAAQDPQFDASVRAYFHRNSYEIAETAPIVQTVRGAVEGVRGTAPEVYGELWWMDSALLAEAGIETVIVGPAGAGAHADEEWVDLASAVDLAHILARSALDFCGRA